MVQLNERETQVAEAEMYELKQARYSSKWYISKERRCTHPACLPLRFFKLEDTAPPLEVTHPAPRFHQEVMVTVAAVEELVVLVLAVVLVVVDQCVAAVVGVFVEAVVVLQTKDQHQVGGTIVIIRTIVLLWTLCSL